MSMEKLPKSMGRLEIALAMAVILLGGQLAWPVFRGWINRPRSGFQVEQRDAAYPYLIYLPETPSNTLMLYLHGSGARGSDLDSQRLGGPASQIGGGGSSIPMIVVSPQCPAKYSWEPQRLRELLDHLQNRFEFQRVVVTGYSMGGGGTWEFAQVYPELVDAAAPVCGCGNPSRAEKLKDVPVWAFHGELDEVIPLKCSSEMVEAINASGGTAKLTTYAEHGHGISRLVYENPRLYEWLLDPRQSNSH